MADESYKQQLRDEIARLREAAIARQATATPDSASAGALATPISTTQVEPSVYDRLKTFMATQPIYSIFPGSRPVTASQLRTGIEEAASIGGSVAGGALGTAFGVPGTILGGALGSYADVPVQTAFDYLLGTTPTISRVKEATKEAGIGAVVEGAMRAVPSAAKYGVSTLSRLLGPKTTAGAEALVGEQLSKWVPRDVLTEAAVEKATMEAAGLPATELTTAQMTGSQTLAQAEQLLKTQPLGNANITFANQAKNQLDEINNAALSISTLKDPNPKVAGQAARDLLEKARDAQNASASAKFSDEIRALPAPVKGISKEAENVITQIYKDSEVLGPSGPVDDLLNQIKTLEAAPKAEKAPAGFGRKAAPAKAAPSVTTIGTLQDLRSKALELSRSAREGTRDELVLDRISDVLGKRIDEVPGTELLAEARNAWRQYKQRWFRDESGQLAPLAKLLRNQSPEDIISAVSKKSAVSDEYAKVLGGLEPNKLATEMADFANKTTVDEKLKWIRSKRAVLADSPIWSTIEQWQNILQRIEKRAEAGVTPALSVENINVQAKALVRALGGAERVAAASPGEAATLSVGGNVLRSAATSRAGGTLSGAGSALAGLLGISTAKERAATVASTLAKALSDPATALKYVDDAAKYGKDAATQIALQESGLVSGAELVSSLAPAGAAAVRSFGMGTSPTTVPAASPKATKQPALSKEKQAKVLKRIEQIQAKLEQKKQAGPTSTPTPAKSVKVGKQNISIPTGKEFAPPDLVKAVIEIESGGKPEAISPKGAAGLMQLMKPAAKEVGITNRLDPEQNIQGGSRYLQKQIDEFGKLELALAAYNWGPSNIRKAKKKLEEKGKRVTWANVMQVAEVPMETRMYVNKVLREYRG